nr:hypothetical protein [uncultured Agathobaculum sp.]
MDVIGYKQWGATGTEQNDRCLFGKRRMLRQYRIIGQERFASKFCVLTGWRGNIFKTLSEKDIRWE